MNWLTIKRQLNAVLDRIAAKGDGPLRDVQVEVMGMIDGTDADFPAIYADLFCAFRFEKPMVAGGTTTEQVLAYRSSGGKPIAC